MTTNTPTAPTPAASAHPAPANPAAASAPATTTPHVGATTPHGGAQIVSVGELHAAGAGHPHTPVHPAGTTTISPTADHTAAGTTTATQAARTAADLNKLDEAGIKYTITAGADGQPVVNLQFSAHDPHMHKIVQALSHTTGHEHASTHTATPNAVSHTTATTTTASPAATHVANPNTHIVHAQHQATITGGQSVAAGVAAAA